MIPRLLTHQIDRVWNTPKAIIILGPRQVGKTTLIRKLLENKEYLFLNGDDQSTANFMKQADTQSLQRIIGNYRFVFVDEAQKINGIGNTLKIITDQFKEVKLLVSGSSSLEMNQASQESLTGRKFEFELCPISWPEYENHEGLLTGEASLEHRLVYGMYPDVISFPHLEKITLKGLSQSYLFQDILALTGIRKPELLHRLLTALALQLGSEVSYNELAQLLQVDKGTILKYIDLLEQSYIIFTLSSYSRNLRNEIKNNRKVYFYDNGIRNAILDNYSPFQLRTDKGALWENFLVSERKKRNAYASHYCNSYFWRTQAQQEVDYIEIADGHMSAFEFKWKQHKNVRFPSNLITEYQPSTHVIDRDNFREFIF